MKILLRTLPIFAALALWGCGPSGDHGHNHEHEHEHEHHDGDGHDEHEHEHEHGDNEEIILKADVAKRMGVETSVLEPANMTEVVKVAGQVLPSPGDVAVAVAPTSGVVTLRQGVVPGLTVGAGSAIASVSAKGISGGDVDQAARVAVDAARREMERAKPLHEQGLITTREYNALVANYEAAQAAYSPRAATGTVTSPIGGAVTEVLVSQGQYVEAGQPVARISKSSTLTLRADLPERYYGMAGHITGANIRAAGADKTVPLHSLNGAGRTFSQAQGGYLPIYFTFSNEGNVAPGSTVEVYLLGSQRQGVLSVPLEAITEQQGAKYVYVKIDDEGYERRPVTTGGNDGIKVEITSGLTAGDNVVVKGATAVRLAENSGKIPEGHSHNH